MKVDAKYVVAALLVLSAGLLAVMVPGGPVETRSFARLAPSALLAFNTFLTSLGICSCIVAYWALRGRHVAFMESVICGGLYLLVYLLDLFRIFPTTVEAMPKMLALLEWLGIMVSIALLLVSWKLASASSRETKARNFPLTLRTMLLFLLVALGAVGIIAFATRSAMR